MLRIVLAPLLYGILVAFVFDKLLYSVVGEWYLLIGIIFLIVTVNPFCDFVERKLWTKDT